jgi:hypothetical protein
MPHQALQRPRSPGRHVDCHLVRAKKGIAIRLEQQREWQRLLGLQPKSVWPPRKSGVQLGRRPNKERHPTETFDHRYSSVPATQMLLATQEIPQQVVSATKHPKNPGRRQ